MANFKTVEQDTRNNWIDGKNVYEKTLVLGTLPVGFTAFPHGIVGLDRLIDVVGAYRNLSNGTWLLFNHPGTTAGNSVNITVDQTDVRVNQSQTGFGDAIVVLRYTKA